jgi:hypothetical protein
MKPLDAEVSFIAPEESVKRDFPRMEGPGRALEIDAMLVLRGRVFGLSFWWLKIAALLLLLFCGALHVAFPDGGIIVGLGALLALVAADFWQQRVGRDYELRILRGCRYRLTQVGERASVWIQLDEWVVGGGKRPPLVELTVAPEHLPRIERLLAGPRF